MNRKWFITINNWNDKEWELMCNMITKCSYGICCKEVGSKCGTPHLHAWFHFKNARGFSVFRKGFHVQIFKKVKEETKTKNI